MTLIDVASRAEAWIETRRRPQPGPSTAVASRAEAWIETSAAKPTHWRRGVASRAEAWIETPASAPCWAWTRPSPPARRRGLKHEYMILYFDIMSSPPARRRGLKPTRSAAARRFARSPPARRRGLKPAVGGGGGGLAGVASRAEAWIETAPERPAGEIQVGRLPRGGVD
mgnify:CR=1 FL=1